MKFRDYSKYEVYEDGRIWSYKSNKWLKPSTTKYGYQQVGLFDNEGKRKCYQVHRVVFEAVSGEPIPECMQCNHINEDKTDNRFCNINLMTPKQNTNWGTRNERAGKAISKANTNNPKLSKSITKALTNNQNISKAVGAFKDGKLVLSFPSTMEAQRQGFNQGNVAASCRNCYIRPGNNKYKGFEWRYI